MPTPLLLFPDRSEFNGVPFADDRLDVGGVVPLVLIERLLSGVDIEFLLRETCASLWAFFKFSYMWHMIVS